MATDKNAHQTWRDGWMLIGTALPQLEAVRIADMLNTARENLAAQPYRDAPHQVHGLRAQIGILEALQEFLRLVHVHVPPTDRSSSKEI